MKRRSGKDGELTRRDFIAVAALAAGGALAANAVGQTDIEAQPSSIAGAEVEFWLTPVSEVCLRISVVAKGSGLDPRTAFAGFGLVERVWPAAPARLGSARQSATWGKRKVELTAEPLALAITGADGELIQRLVFDATTGRVRFDLQDTPVFGLGDRRGVVDAMRNGQFKPDQLVNGGRSPIPWLISPAGWGLFFHHPMGTFDLTGKQGIFRPAEPAQPQDIFLIASKDPAMMLREFALLTGMPHLPPVWALGYQQSHRTLASREEVLQEAKTFRAKHLPCDVMIYLGTGFAPSGWNTGHGSFAFDRAIFPDPEAMFHEMHDEGFRVVLHVLGAPHDLHGRVADRSADPDDAVNYWREHEQVFRTGNDGWWVDDGDELFPEERASVFHSAQWLRGAAALRVSVVGRYQLELADAARAGCGWAEHGAERSSLLGHGYGRFLLDQRADGRAVRALVSVERVLPAVSFARTDVEAASALGLEHGRRRAGGR